MLILQKFFLGGRLIFGPDAKSLIATVSMITVPVILFCALVGRHLRHKFSQYDAGYAILVIAIVFTIYVSFHNPSSGTWLLCSRYIISACSSSECHNILVTRCLYLLSAAAILVSINFTFDCTPVPLLFRSCISYNSKS